MMQFGLSEHSYAIIRNIFEKYPALRKVIIYGSRAKGSHNERSDVDLVITDSEIDRHTLGNILLDINDSDFPFTADLQLLESIKNRKLTEHIQRVGIDPRAKREDDETSEGGSASFDKRADPLPQIGSRQSATTPFCS
ncbi:MAG: nucleotidyltransferase domain-containing protein, partial [Chitinophagaceae bacterium]